MDERSKIGSPDNELTVDFRIDASFTTNADTNTVSPGPHSESNIDNLLDQYRGAANEEAVLVKTYFESELASIATRKNSATESLIGCIYCEESLVILIYFQLESLVVKSKEKCHLRRANSLITESDRFVSENK